MCKPNLKSGSLEIILPYKVMSVVALHSIAVIGIAARATSLDPHLRPTKTFPQCTYFLKSKEIS